MCPKAIFFTTYAKTNIYESVWNQFNPLWLFPWCFMAQSSRSIVQRCSVAQTRPSISPIIRCTPVSIIQLTSTETLCEQVVHLVFSVEKQGRSLLGGAAKNMKASWFAIVFLLIIVNQFHRPLIWKVLEALAVQSPW